MAYEVSTEIFDGPFDLLLHLILRDELDIHEVSLSRIVTAYLDHVSRMEALDLEIATEFLLIAATLVEMKAKRLVPNREAVDLDEELALWEERDLLLSRLLDAKTFKDVAGVFGALLETASLSAPRRSGPDERFASLVPDLLDGVTPARLRRAFIRSLQAKAPTVLDLGHVTPVTVSVADALIDLLHVLPSLGETTFRAVTDDCVERLDVVVRFLAILELFKQGRVDLAQTERFGDIVIRWIEGAEVAPDVALIVDEYEG